MNLTQKLNSKASQVRNLSTKLNLKKSLSSDKPPNPQPFVKTRLRPGESNPLSELYNKKPNPTYRPRWKNKAQIISAEDYAARPRVSFEEEFDSMHDAMVVLSWIDEKQRQEIYQMYLEMIVEQEKEFKTTSHEYLMRVIAEKFNISAMRVSSIVQMCHDEEQAAKEGMVHEKLAKYVDAKIKEHINNAYMAYGEVNPNEFVEDPVGSVDLRKDKGEVVRVEDLYDVDDLMKKADVREKGEAQLLIDEHVYVEDIDDGKIQSKANADCIKLLKAEEKFNEIKDSFRRKEGDSIENALPDNGFIEDDDGNKTETERRPRWKFVAKTINIREQKKLGKNSRRGGKLKPRQQKDNTLVEDDGSLRLATVQELSQTSWRPERNVNEFTFKGVKAAWMSRKHKGEKNGWGRVPDSLKVKKQDEVKENLESSDGDQDNEEKDALEAEAQEEKK